MRKNFLTGALWNGALLVLLCGNSLGTKAQEATPLNRDFEVTGGIGLVLPAVDSDKSNFVSKNGNHCGYALLAEGRYHLSDVVGVGLQYDYLRSAKFSDKMHVHYVGPNVSLRHLFSDDTQAVYISAGCGFLNYQDRVYPSGNHSASVYNKNYFAVAAGVGYQFRLTNDLAGTVRIDVLTADWFVNPDGRLYNPHPDYDDHKNHNWFDNDITFFQLSLGLTFGFGE